MKRKVLIILGWVCLWQLLAAVIHNDILMVGPLQVLSALFSMVRQPSFWISIISTMTRIIAGFLAGTMLGILLSWLAYEHSLVREILQPLMLFLKAVPVVSFIVLILIFLLIHFFHPMTLYYIFMILQIQKFLIHLKKDSIRHPLILPPE